ncbi:hypothetical protein [Bernardetia sp. MNP-M8]|uniref:hypothetical protein n=1 Tax=Bernardetia sp. MNP-M8 TaxID=3127470 RepID=UPI0030D08A72
MNILNEAYHNTNWGKAYYDSRGVSISLLGIKKKIFIEWNNVEFVCPNPYLEKNNGEWRDFEGKDSQELKHLELKLSVKNRYKILDKIHTLLRICFGLILNIKPLIGADDNYLSEKGVITINVKLGSLSCSKNEFLDLLSQHAKFGLIVSF